MVFLYSVHTDHAGHKYGWMSREYLQSIEEADQQIGIFFQKLRQEDLFNDTHFLFLTDHGGIGKGHGGTSAAEMIVPWGISGPGIKRNFLISEPNNTTNTAPMLLHLFGGKPLPEWTGKVIESVLLFLMQFTAFSRQETKHGCRMAFPAGVEPSLCRWRDGLPDR